MTAIAGVEVVSVLARKSKGNLLSRQKAGKTINRFQNHFDRRYQKVNVTPDVVIRAMALTSTFCADTTRFNSRRL